MKDVLVFLGLLAALSCCKEKEDNIAFEIHGKMEANLDSVHVYPGFISKKFLDTTLYDFSSIVDKGNFSFKGKAPYPQMMNLHSPKIGISTPFFIEEGYTNLSVSFINRDRKVQISENTKSQTQKEYELLVSTKLDSIYQNIKHSKSREERMKHSKDIDHAIINHLRENPNSYVALWLMIDRFCKSGSEYNKSYENALLFFSKEIQNIPLYKIFKNNLIKKKNFSFENTLISLKSLDNQPIVFDIKNHKNKYILIDFWFSFCKPCLLEMPKYIPIYSKYKKHGFEIVSISVDNTEDIPNWIKVINENNFSWSHYLDENGLETRKLDIVSFPTTFLVDANGKIIEKNLSAEKLNEFLGINLDK
ncbi:AhpC/TSA family protein [Muricauda sp. SCSIO 64092]|uniref:TlpA disulfide reductase family protein n=1 Tax=Allomuricauda sp. SCSIO 64092 TaxID=2908842 RepID=UPI001FF4F53A|nr:TlpA disulfide reductase family protein [Muricauda sp. SCSIO 64092]UOY08571.1 AhpC/TSA family protein [Muricauda sp. SCSIO 64092]